MSEVGNSSQELGKSPDVYICRKNGYFLRLPHHVTFFTFLTIFILKGPTVHWGCHFLHYSGRWSSFVLERKEWKRRKVVFLISTHTAQYHFLDSTLSAFPWASVIQNTPKCSPVCCPHLRPTSSKNLDYHNVILTRHCFTCDFILFVLFGIKL